MRTDFDILVDSDAFVGLFLDHDTHHAECQQQLRQFQADNRVLVTTSFVVSETATVLSHLDGQTMARDFFDTIQSHQFPVIFISETLQTAAEKVFYQQEKKGTSMVDCANVAVMQQFHIPTIWSFDRFYFRRYQFAPAE